MARAAATHLEAAHTIAVNKMHASTARVVTHDTRNQRRCGMSEGFPHACGRVCCMAGRVVVGAYCKGVRDALTPDVRPGHGHMLYDSTVNDLKTPEIYVTFHDAQACTHRATSKELTHSPSHTNARRAHACPSHDPGHVPARATPTKPFLRVWQTLNISSSSSRPKPRPPRAKARRHASVIRSASKTLLRSRVEYFHVATCNAPFGSPWTRTMPS